MKDTFYFSHDYNAQNDEKILKLMSSLGWEGYGLFWGLIEKLYEANGKLEKDYKTIAFGMRTDSERIRTVIEDFNLFIVTDKNISSKAVDERLKIRKDKSNKARISANIKWNNANALRTDSDSYAIKERKGKERKGNTIGREDDKSSPSQESKLFFNDPVEQARVLNSLIEKGFDKDIASREISKFIFYWTELNKLGNKQRWELEKTFEVGKRLATWFSRINNFSNNNKAKTITSI